MVKPAANVTVFLGGPIPCARATSSLCAGEAFAPAASPLSGRAGWQWASDRPCFGAPAIADRHPLRLLEERLGLVRRRGRERLAADFVVRVRFERNPPRGRIEHELLLVRPVARRPESVERPVAAVEGGSCCLRPNRMSIPRAMEQLNPKARLYRMVVRAARSPAFRTEGRSAPGAPLPGRVSCAPARRHLVAITARPIRTPRQRWHVLANCPRRTHPHR